MSTVLVVIHVVAGILGLVTGCVAIRPVASRSLRWLRGLYPLCLATLLASMAVLIGIDWAGLETGARVAFSGLAALGVVMAYRMTRALQESRSRRRGWEGRYVAHVYFTYIAVWVGFLVLPALNLPLPQVSVPFVVLVVLGSGHVAVTRYRRRALAS